MSNYIDPEPGKAQKLPRRDWLVLPMLSVLTIGLIAGTTEYLARQIYPQVGGHFYDCVTGPTSGIYGVPNSVCWGNRADSPPTEYRLNRWGNRTGMERGTKPKGVYRIVLLGSSFAIGEGVPEPKTIAALLPMEVSRQTGQNIDLYNEGMFSEIPHIIVPHFYETLAAKPDMILWLLTPHDIELESKSASIDSSAKVVGKDDVEPEARIGMGARIQRHLYKTFSTKPIPDAIRETWNLLVDESSPHINITSVVLLRHILYKDQTRYVRSYLLGDSEAGFLRTNPNAEWSRGLEQFKVDYAQIEQQATKAGVPLVVTLAPSSGQAAMISMNEWPDGYDPYMLNHELRSIVAQHGGAYIDTVSGFRNIPSPERLYFKVNGHPNIQGCAILSALLAKELTGGEVPLLKATVLRTPHWSPK